MHSLTDCCVENAEKCIGRVPHSAYDVSCVIGCPWPSVPQLYRLLLLLLAGARWHELPGLLHPRRGLSCGCIGKGFWVTRGRNSLLADRIQTHAAMSVRRLASGPSRRCSGLPAVCTYRSSRRSRPTFGSALRNLNGVAVLCTRVRTLLTVTNTPGTLIVDNARARLRTPGLADIDDQTILCERRHHRQHQRYQGPEAFDGESYAH